jgi:autotransporter-associated beta strand protein
VLVLRSIEEPCTLATHHNQGRIPTRPATWMGRALAALHSLKLASSPISALSERLPRRLPDALFLHRPDHRSSSCSRERAIGNAGALGTGTVTLDGGELLGTTNETLTNVLALSGTSTIAAAHGTTLTENGDDNIAGSSTLNFGAPGQDGTIVWEPNGGSEVEPNPDINVEAGTLKGAAAALIDDSRVVVAGGATLHLAGRGAEFGDLGGGGSVIDSGAAATLMLDFANFAGSISGPLSLEVTNTVILSGKNTYTGTTTIESGVLFELGGAGTIGGGAIIDGTFEIVDDSAVTVATPFPVPATFNSSAAASPQSTPPTLTPAARRSRERSPLAMAARWAAERSH